MSRPSYKLRVKPKEKEEISKHIASKIILLARELRFKDKLEVFEMAYKYAVEIETKKHEKIINQIVEKFSVKIKK